MTDDVKTTTIDLTISTNYVPNWGLWEALRELIQNALDAQDAGFPFSIERTRDVGRASGQGLPIRIINEGASLDRASLLLGTTTKGSGNARGQFGEGYKLAFLVLARLGLKVVVKNRDEIWEPFLAHSTVFGAELLKVKVRPCALRDRVAIEIYGVSDADWGRIQERVLDLNPPKNGEEIKLGRDRILTAERFSNQLYVKGLYVGPMPDGYEFGYDLQAVKLDRDRRLADPWDLAYEIRTLFRRAVDSNDIPASRVLSLLESESGEAKTLAAHYKYSSEGDSLTQKLATAFREKYGAEAVAVASYGEAKEAEHLAVKAIQMPRAVVDVIAREIGSIEKIRTTKKMDAVARYAPSDLSVEERENLEWASALLTSVEAWFSLDAVQVVDFRGPELMGLYTTGLSGERIFIAKRVLACRVKTLETMVHEVAHRYGADGDVTHERRQVEILSKICAARIA